MIKEFDINDMTHFIMELINVTEERLLQQLHEQGYDASLVRLSPELQYADNLAFLLKEVDDNEYDDWYDSDDT